MLGDVSERRIIVEKSAWKVKGYNVELKILSHIIRGGNQ